VNSPNSRTVKNCTKIVLFLMAFFLNVTVKAWEVDLSRRKKELEHSRLPASIVDQPKKENSEILGSFFESLDPSQEIVILNTDKGFVPETVRLKKGQNYKIHIVNVNEKEKNTSFILDAFSEHHATYFGQEKNFSMSPKTAGIFSFLCPETAKQGRIVVSDSESGRKPAGE
jgi:hypothetical protein